MHLRHKHFMADNDPRDESPEAGLLSKKDFLEAADKLFPKTT